MFNSKRLFLMSSFAVCLLGTTAVAEEKMAPHAGHAAAEAQHAGHAGGDGGSEQLHKHMMKSASESQSMAMTGDADHDFVTMMKMHHQHGIEMAQIELASGKDPRAMAFAKKIIAAQKKEIAQFDAWLAKQKPTPAK